MKRYVVTVPVVLPDGSAAWFPIRRFAAGEQTGSNPPAPAVFVTMKDAREWQRLCLADRARVVEEEAEDVTD